MIQKNQEGLSAGFGFAACPPLKEINPSLSNRSLGDITERFVAQKGRTPSNYELYLSSSSDICYHSTPQLTSNLFAKNRVLQDERASEIVGGEIQGNYIGNFQRRKRTILANSEEGTCFQDLLETKIQSRKFLAAQSLTLNRKLIELIKRFF